MSLHSEITDKEMTASKAGLVRMMTARFPGKCALCGGRIRPGKDEIGYSSEAKLAFCRGCAARYSTAQDVPTAEQVRRLIVATIGQSGAAAKSVSDRRTWEQRASDYLDGDESALGGGPEER